MEAGQFVLYRIPDATLRVNPTTKHYTRHDRHVCLCADADVIGPLLISAKIVFHAAPRARIERLKNLRALP